MPLSDKLRGASGSGPGEPTPLCGSVGWGN